MIVLYLCIVIFNVTASVFTKLNAKKGGEVACYNLFRAIVPLCAFAVAALILGDELTPRLALFGLLYGLSSAGATLCGYYALSMGPMGITSAIATFSLVPVSLWCVIFLKEQVTAFKVIGTVLAVLALIIMNAEKFSGDFNKKKWLALSFATLAFNAASSILVVYAGGEAGGVGFTAFAQVVPSVAFGAIFAFNKIKSRKNRTFNTIEPQSFSAVEKSVEKSEPQAKKFAFIKTAAFGAVAGCATAASALVTFLLSARSDGSELFPLVAVLNLFGVFLAGTFIFKEKPTLKRIIAIITAAAAILFLKLA